MSEAQLERTTVKIDNNKNSKQFTANGEVITFDGFLKIYIEGTDSEEDEEAGMLPKWKLMNYWTIDILLQPKDTLDHQHALRKPLW